MRLRFLFQKNIMADIALKRIVHSLDCKLIIDELNSITQMFLWKAPAPSMQVVFTTLIT